jgi:hypothetical protein
MFGEHVECPVDVEHEVEATEQRLVGTDAGQPAAGEPIERQCRDADCVELARPHVDVGCHSAGACCSTTTGSCPCRTAGAQPYPTRPVRLIAPFPAGGVVDLFSRLLAQPLSERLGQSVVVENRAGAGGNLGTEAAVRATPDGYTLLLMTSTNAINQTLYDKLNFDIVRDIIPIASINRGIGVLEVHPSFPARTVAEFIAYLKANPGRVLCHEYRRSKRRCATIREMKEGPSSSAIRC